MYTLNVKNRDIYLKDLYRRLNPDNRTESSLWIKNLEKGLHLGQGFVLQEYFSRKRAFPSLRQIYVPTKLRNQHFGCIGASGCGKTSLMKYLIKQDIYAGNNILIIDPKGVLDFFAYIVEIATQAGRLEDILYVSPVYPDFSTKINLLKYYQLPDEVVDHIASGIKSKDEYYKNVAYEMSLAIVLGLLALAKARGEKDLQVNFYEIKKRCSYSALEELSKSVEYFTTSPDPEIAQNAKDVKMTLDHILKSPPDFFSKVSSSLRTILTAMSISSTGKIVGKANSNEFIHRIENGQRTILFCSTANPLTRRVAHILGKVVMSMVQAAVGRAYSRGKPFDPPVCIYIDEGHNVLYSGIGDLFAQGREANVWIHFFTQSFAEIVQAIGEEEATAIMDNISTWCFMRVNHEDSAKKIEELSAEAQDMTRAYSFEDGELLITMRELKRKLVSAPDVLNLPNRMFFLRLDGVEYKGETAFVEHGRIKLLPPKLREEITDVA